MKKDFTMRGKFLDGTVVMTQADLDNYAGRIGLPSIVPNRFSYNLVFQLYANERVVGLDPIHVVDQIKALEDGTSRGTKAPTPFRYPPLKGLFHQHFFAPHFMAMNMHLQLSGGRLEQIVADTLPINGVLTKEMIIELSDRVTVQQFEERYAQNKVTGEWIVYAVLDGEKYYLTISKHTTSKAEDQALYDHIALTCWPQFPFLSQIFSGASDASTGPLKRE